MPPLLPLAVSTLAILAFAKSLPAVEPLAPAADPIEPAPQREDLGYAVPNYAPQDIPGTPVPDYPPVPDRSIPPNLEWQTPSALRERFDVPPDSEIKAYGVELDGTDVERR